jgi:fumarylacetoacetase
MAYLTPGAGSAGAGHGLNVTLEVLLRSAKMREAGTPAMRVSIGSFREMYWTFAQMIAHHASGGCPLQAGDLIASGTVSGPEPESRGCLLERTWAGMGADGKPLPRTALKLPTGEERTFLGDGDEVILRGWGEAQVHGGTVRVSLGECRGVVVGAETAGGR